MRPWPADGGMLSVWRALGRAAALAALASPSLAYAGPEEIQVYIDDMDDPGTFGLDLHLNYVGTGQSTLRDYAGAEDSLHRLRITPEFSYGITRNLEAGLYLPLATIDRFGHFNLGGVKGRLKWVTHPKGNPNLWYGLNWEVGRVDRRLDENPWNSELKGIVGTRRGKWLLAANANVDFVVSGPAPAPATLEIATKASYDVAPKLALGLEAYNGVGELRRLGRFASSDQTVLATADVGLGKWDLNLGAGRGFGTNPDRLVLKAILGIPIEGILHRVRR